MDSDILEKEAFRTSNLNTKEWEKIIPFCLHRDGYICNICKTPIPDLVLKDKIKREIEGKPPRKLPIILINHIDGTRNRDRTINGKEIPFANVEIACWSCNRKYKPPEIDYQPNEERTYASRKSHQAYQGFVKKVNDEISKFKHVCLQESLNIFSKDLKCSQDALFKYTKREIGTRWALIDKVKMDLDCDYYFCDTRHLCFIEEVPQKKLSDYEVYQEEKESRDDFISDLSR